jgi:hypothetical protein
MRVPRHPTIENYYVCATSPHHRKLLYAGTCASTRVTGTRSFTGTLARTGTCAPGGRRYWDLRTRGAAAQGLETLGGGLLIYHLILYSSMERPVATPRPEEGLRALHRLCAPTRQRQHAHASCVSAARSAGQGCNRPFLLPILVG